MLHPAIYCWYKSITSTTVCCIVICCWCKNITSPTVQNPASVIIRGNNPLLPRHNTESPMERLIWYRGSCKSPSWYIPYMGNINLQKIPNIHICCIQHWVSNWILGCNTLWKNLHLKQNKFQFSCTVWVHLILSAHSLERKYDLWLNKYLVLFDTTNVWNDFFPVNSQRGHALDHSFEPNVNVYI